MLLVHPVTEVVRVAPALVVSLIIGSQHDDYRWTLLGLLIVVSHAILRWFTTSYRFGPVHIELRTGVFRKQRLSVPRSRIRSVEAKASFLHRVLGLAVVHIGTGSHAHHEHPFELNALDAKLVPKVRAALLTKDAVPQESTRAPADRRGTEIAHFSLAWVRYAPFSLTGVVAVGTIAGVIFQNGLGQRIADSAFLTGVFGAARSFGLVAMLACLLVALLVFASALACVRYVLSYGRLTVIDDGTVLHVSHGLLTTRQTSLDSSRLRGTTLAQPLLLRLAGGARLDAIMTGVRVHEHGSSLLLPSAPRAEAIRVSGTVTGTRTQDDVRLVHHGPAATRRRYVRALSPVAMAAAGLAIASRYVQMPSYAWWALAAATLTAIAVAWDRARGLGHAVLPGWLITQTGSLDRKRHTLQSSGIIGWTVRQTYFQRRAGLATVIAATPAGKGRYEVVDIPAERAWQLVDAVTPGAGDIWLVPRH
ncbi:PH domain-containing protein [Skermania sp. ID1734]|uniref:PH domain-containing protein n=1 Tax=Skermania sp. ID1734 TaxID=2597516 RepID=UPI00117E2763|nr:PH domain-containing protein [Skermania sp. ID1734]